ncbi:MAG: V-type ATPase subunit [Bacillota bacterium]
MNNEYIYAVTRIHGQEGSLLNAQDLEQLLGAHDVDEFYRQLAEKGWSSSDCPISDSDTLMTHEREKTYSLIRELLGDLAPLNVLFCENDFHNLKAAIKLVYTEQECENPEQYFLQPSAISPDDVLCAVRQHDFVKLPPALAEAGFNAYEILMQTGNGQACEMAIDYAALLAIDAEGKRSGIGLLQRYAEQKVDTTNIKAAVRACRMGKGRDFLMRAIAPAGSLYIKGLIDAAESGLDDIYEYLMGTQYAGAVDSLRDSLAAFECWCDNRLMESIRPQKYEYFSIEPLAAYVLGKENEIAMVRLILSAKINRLSDAVIRKRWRLLYV